MKKLILTVLGIFVSAAIGFSQIVTASDFFNTVSDHYAGLYTYECDVTMSFGDRNMVGHASFKRPQMLRIDFSSPSEQTILFDGSTLVIYLPGQQTILQQAVTGNDTGVSSRGLTLLRRYYVIAFQDSSTPVPYGDSGASVVNLVLRRRTASEAFTSIKLSVNAKTHMIMQAVATTPQGQTYTFVFYNYSLNPEIPDRRFIYDPPSSANQVNNFLFQE